MPRRYRQIVRVARPHLKLLLGRDEFRHASSDREVHEAPDHRFNALRLRPLSTLRRDTGGFHDFRPVRPSVDVAEGAGGHAVSSAAFDFRPADCLGLAREDCGVCAKFASERHGAILHDDASGDHPTDLTLDAASRCGTAVDR